MNEPGRKMVIESEGRARGAGLQGPLRLLVSLALGLATLLALRWSYAFVQAEETPRLVAGLVALGAGVLGVWLLFWLGNDVVAHLPAGRIQEALQPVVFVGPALLLLFAYLVYPALNTIYISFFDERSRNFVGLENFLFAFRSPDVQIVFRNNLMWLVLVTGFSVALGLLIAVLVDRVRHEAAAKSFIFLPLAISFVGASVIWRFVYAFAPAGRPQIGLLNAIVVALGREPVGWLIERSFNNFALIAIMIWLQTGFCMIVFSAALKSIPSEITEAARMDGATEVQTFFRITLPMLQGTMIAVATTVIVAVLKVFDVVFVMTNGQFDTQVLANRMYAEMFTFRNFGHASALAVILLVAVIPVMVINVRNLREQRSRR
jgi:alpha-glucoside transport system permease protein